MIFLIYGKLLPLCICQSQDCYAFEWTWNSKQWSSVREECLESFASSCLWVRVTPHRIKPLKIETWFGAHFFLIGHRCLSVWFILRLGEALALEWNNWHHWIYWDWMNLKRLEHFPIFGSDYIDILFTWKLSKLGTDYIYPYMKAGCCR